MNRKISLEDFNLPKTPTNVVQGVNSCLLYEEIGLYGVDYNEYDEVEHDKRFSYYGLNTWTCTDSEVGTRVYLFDGQPFAISYQLGRKYREDFYWVSEEMFNKVREFLISTFKLKQYNPIYIDTLPEHYVKELITPR